MLQDFCKRTPLTAFETRINKEGKCETCKSTDNDCGNNIVDYVRSKVRGSEDRKDSRGENRKTFEWKGDRSDINGWQKDEWNIATQFMPEMYSDKKIAETDLNGFLNFMTRCTLFLQFLRNRKICFEVSSMYTFHTLKPRFHFVFSFYLLEIVGKVKAHIKLLDVTPIFFDDKNFKFL